MRRVNTFYNLMLYFLYIIQMFLCINNKKASPKGEALICQVCKHTISICKTPPSSYGCDTARKPRLS